MNLDAEARRKVTHALLAVAMAVFAWVNLDDPDPWLWVSLYGAAAALFVLALFGWVRRWPVIALWLVYGVFALMALPGFLEWLLQRPWSHITGAMSPERQYIEDSRELLGLAIAGLSLLALWRGPAEVPKGDRHRAR